MILKNKKIGEGEGGGGIFWLDMMWHEWNVETTGVDFPWDEHTLLKLSDDSSSKSAYNISMQMAKSHLHVARC